MDKENVSLRVVENIKLLCKLHNLKIGELEDVVGVSQGYFSRFKINTRNMSLDTAYKVSQHFNISMDELCTFPKDLIMYYI